MAKKLGEELNLMDFKIMMRCISKEQCHEVFLCMQMSVKQNNSMGCISNSSMEIVKVILTHTGASKSFKREKTQKLSSSNI